MSDTKKILVTGGGGYLGSSLVPELLRRGYAVRVLDTFMFGAGIFDPLKDNDKLDTVQGDICDRETVERALNGCDTVIHLAAISNDPCSDLDEKLTRAVNSDAIKQLVPLAKESGVTRYISASSSSVYGIKDDPEVTEELPLEPITLYAKLKAESEEIVNKYTSDDFVTVNVRSATICGYSPRMRLDLTVNILTSLAVNNGVITVFGGKQKRPNVHMDDIVNLYADLVEAPADKINGDVFNYGTDNFTVMRIAEMVREVVGENVEIKVTESDDDRSYHVSSEKIKQRLGFEPKKTITDAIIDVRDAFRDGKIPDYTDTRYYNVKKMKELGIG